MTHTRQLSTRTGFTVFPIRYTADSAAMVAFLQALGLSQVLAQPHGSYAVMQAASGRVMLHSATGAKAGGTALGFEVAQAQDAAERLAERGVDVTVWDEAYGQHVGIRDPRGGGLWISEQMADLYGYRQVEQAQPADIDVTAVYYTTDFAAARAFFGRLGFGTDQPDNPDYLALRAAERAGVVGLHAIDADPPLGLFDADDPMAPLAAAIHLGFETGQDLQDLAGRLRRAGYPDAGLEGNPVHVRVTDPDGRSVEVFPRG